MKMKFPTIAALLASLWLLPMAATLAGEEENDKLRDVIAVIDEISQITETSIPPSLLAEAESIAVIPGVFKVGFILGGRSGKGIIMTRDPETGEWGYPVFITLIGTSIGWQAGAQASDVVLVFKNRRGAISVLKGSFTIGADASISAGPMGRDTAAATDAQMNAEIYSYSRSRGLFAGVSLDGSALEVDLNATEAYYGANINPLDILENKLASGAPDGAEKLRRLIETYTKEVTWYR